MRLQRLFLVIVLAVFVTSMTACESAQFRAREKGALAGGALGAGLGAIVGNQVGSSGAGIAIGSAVGALSGAVIGNEIDRQEDRLDESDRRLESQERELQENKRLLQELRSNGIDARETSRGLVVNLPDVLFEFDSSRLQGSSRREIGLIADAIQKASGRHVAVEGHTDSVGSSSYNHRLSEARARSVASALGGEGVSRNRMSVKGFGENKPIASNSTSSGRAKNRRVEVIIEK